MIFSFSKKSFFLVFFVIFFITDSGIGICQNIGDYRSVSSGNWVTLSTWERFNGTSWVIPSPSEGSPGQYTGTNTVTIQTGHNVTVGTSGISTQPMGVVIIQNNAQLYLNSTNTLTTYYFNTPILSVVGPNGSIYFNNKIKLVIATNGVIFVGSNGLLGDCNNNVQIWIGNVQYAACAGAPGNIFTFAQVMAANAGGTLNAVLESNSPLCETGTINLTGTYTGAIGSIPTYNWVVSFPGGSDSTYNTQNVTIYNAQKGTYSATLTVTTILNGTSYSSTKSITVLVNPLPTLSGATQASYTCTGSPATISLSGLLPGTTFSLNYTINGVAQSPITGLISNSAGNSSFNTPVLSTANNGQILRVTGITVTSSVTNCFNSFSQDVVLSVWENGSWTGAVSSDWNISSNWCGGIPTSTTDVIIRQGTPYQPSIGALGGVCRNITINQGASLVISSANTLTINGNFTNNGTFTPNSSTVIFNGSTTLTGSSATTFHNITINSSKLLTLHSINTTITGNFNNNGAFEHNSGTIIFGGSVSQNINCNNSPFYNLTITNISMACIANSNVFVLNNFTTNPGATLNMGIFALIVNNISHSGVLITQNTSSLPFSQGKNWGGTIVFSGSSAQTFVSGTYNNITISGSGGVNANNDLTINGILSLSSQNPTSNKGILDMSSFILFMGVNSTTVGQGDVTGIIKRSSLISGTSYTFGNQYTYVNFQNVGNLPSELSIKVSIGSSPFWFSSSVRRYYDIIQTGAVNSIATIALHYLDSELNGNNENDLVFWKYYTSNQFLSEQGKNNYNTSQNWVIYNDLNVSDLNTNFGQNYFTLSNYSLPAFVWNGSISSEWTNKNNWSKNAVPGSNDKAVIPDTNYSFFDPILPQSTSLGSLIIKNNGVLNTSSNSQLTITGNDSSWCNSGGLFNFGNSTVVFAGSNANYYGFSEFYNIVVNSNSNFIMNYNSHLKVKNVINIYGLVNTNQLNTIEYSGNNQNIAITNPLNFKYFNLILSGQGSKDFPNEFLVIDGNLLIKERANAYISDSVIVEGNLTIIDSSVLTLVSTAKLTVKGIFDNNLNENNLILLSDYNGSASLIHNSFNVRATVKRYINGNTEDWHLLSSPVSNQEISGDWLPSGTYGNGTGYDLYVWNEPTNCWIYKLNTTAQVNWNTVHPSNFFVVLKGYLYSFQEKNPIKQFKGILNNDEQKISLTNISNDANFGGFNLIGNPFPSSIDWQSDYGWTRGNLISNGGGYDMWIWNESAGNYGVCSSIPGSIGTNGVTRYIPPMHGFFVQALQNDNVKVNNKARVHDNASVLYKSHNADQKSVSISIKSNKNNTRDEVKLIFFDENQRGATKLFSHKKTSPSLFLKSNEYLLSVKYIIDSTYYPFEPVFFNAGIEGNYTFQANFDNSKFNTIMLEDCKTKYIQNLKYKKDYIFKASYGDDIMRFKLHFGCDTNAIFNQLPAMVFSDGTNLNIDLTLVNDETFVEIFSSIGRNLLTVNLKGKQLHRLNLNIKKQLLIARLTCAQGNKVVKVIF